MDKIEDIILSNNSLSSNCYLINFSIRGDERGSLISIEEMSNIPFTIKRIYYIYDNLPHIVRGKHAHKDLQQVLIAISGKCKVKTFDGKNEKIFNLDNPAEGLFIGKNIWREMFDFSLDCILLVLADNIYDEQEYIRNYEDFLIFINS